jgi:hypothetical protein
MYFVEYTCTRNDTSVTMKSIITARPSTWIPTPNLTFAFCHHVNPDSTAETPPSWVGSSECPNPRSVSSASWSLTRWIHWTAVMQERTNAAPTAPTASSAPFFGRRFPNSRISTNDAAGSSGMIQAFRSTTSQPFNWSTRSRSGLRRLR